MVPGHQMSSLHDWVRRSASSWECSRCRALVVDARRIGLGQGDLERDALVPRSDMLLQSDDASLDCDAVLVRSVTVE